MAEQGEAVCECGDYKSDHVNGTGACKMNGLGHCIPDDELNVCKRFVFAGYETVKELGDG